MGKGVGTHLGWRCRVGDGGGGAARREVVAAVVVVVVVGKEQPMGSVEPRFPIWPGTGRAVRRSHTHALLSNKARGPCAAVMY